MPRRVSSGCPTPLSPTTTFRNLKHPDSRVLDLLAETASALGSSWIDALAKLGVAGALCVLLWFLLVRYVPAIEKRHETERAEWRRERDGWREYLKKRDEQFERLFRDVESLMRSLERRIGKE